MTTWLSPEEWAKFDELFDKREGTNYYDAREQILGIIGTFSSEAWEVCNEDKKLGLTDLLMVAHSVVTKHLETCREYRK